MPQQLVRNPIQPRQRQASVILSQQLAQPRVLSQPLPTRQLRSRRGHPRNHAAHRRRAFLPIESQLRQQTLEAQAPHRPQPRLLHPHRTRVQKLQRFHIHFNLRLQPRPRPSLPLPRKRRSAANHQPCRTTPRRFLQFPRKTEQGSLPMEDPLDPLAQFPPPLPRNAERPPQVEQGHLSHPRPDALTAHQAAGEIRLSAPAATSRGLSDIHTASVSRLPVENNTPQKYYGTTKRKSLTWYI